jgi:adenine phosphoribosyltransferase
MVKNAESFDLDTAIRKVPDFPKSGILFYDITSILTNPTAFRFCIDSIVDRFKERNVNSIAAIEARGFLFAAPIAERLGIPLILVRKRGKLPGPTISKSFTLEYGQEEIFVHRSDISHGTRILLLDDLVATGGTLRAAADLLEEAGGVVEAVCCVIGLPFLGFEKLFPEVTVERLIDFSVE